MGVWSRAARDRLRVLARGLTIAYHAAHYYTCLFIQSYETVSHHLDPFGWGWNPFSKAAGYEIRVGVVDAAFADTRRSR